MFGKARGNFTMCAITCLHNTLFFLTYIVASAALNIRKLKQKAIYLHGVR